MARFLLQILVITIIFFEDQVKAFNYSYAQINGQTRR